MNETVIVRLVLLVGVVAAIGYFFVWPLIRQRRATEPLADAEPGSDAARHAEAQAIIARGGPQNDDEYYLLFPEACPVCGARTREEGVIAFDQLPSSFAASPAEPQQVWRCPRCGEGFDPATGDVRQVATRRIFSPYIDAQTAEQIPEPEYVAGAGDDDAAAAGS